MTEAAAELVEAEREHDWEAIGNILRPHVDLHTPPQQSFASRQTIKCGTFEVWKRGGEEEDGVQAAPDDWTRTLRSSVTPEHLFDPRDASSLARLTFNPASSPRNACIVGHATHQNVPSHFDAQRHLLPRDLVGLPPGMNAMPKVGVNYFFKSHRIPTIISVMRNIRPAAGIILSSLQKTGLLDEDEHLV